MFVGNWSVKFDKDLIYRSQSCPVVCSPSLHRDGPPLARNIWILIKDQTTETSEALCWTCELCSDTAADLLRRFLRPPEGGAVNISTFSSLQLDGPSLKRTSQQGSSPSQHRSHTICSRCPGVDGDLQHHVTSDWKVSTLRRARRCSWSDLRSCIQCRKLFRRFSRRGNFFSSPTLTGEHLYQTQNVSGKHTSRVVFGT